jgi:aspartate carbamoyltransferase catalytic subunit
MMARHVKASVINAGDGINEHPTQARGHATIMQYKGGIEGLKVAIVGDVIHSRVARSNIFGLTTMGVRFGWPALPPSPSPGCELEGVEYTTSVEDAVHNADVVMALRIQLERHKKGLFPSVSEYSRFFRINPEVMKLARPDALVCTPGPSTAASNCPAWSPTATTRSSTSRSQTA